MAVITIPQVTNWSVTPQNGQEGYFTLMNTWLSESTTVIQSFNTAVAKINENNVEITQISLNTLAYRDTTKIYRDESLVNKDLSLQYKTAAELAYNNTETLLSTLVLPTGAAYSVDGSNGKFQYKTDSFLNFNIGE